MQSLRSHVIQWEADPACQAVIPAGAALHASQSGWRQQENALAEANALLAQKSARRDAAKWSYSSFCLPSCG